MRLHTKKYANKGKRQQVRYEHEKNRERNLKAFGNIPKMRQKLR